MTAPTVEVEDEWRHQRDAALISTLKVIARRHGYNLVVHGSRSAKDLDLLAIPWTPKAIEPMRLIRMLARQGELTANITKEELKGTVTAPNKPHGRYAIILISHCAHRHIDLSVILPR